MALSPEILLLSSIIQNDDFQTALAAGLNDEMFHTHSEEFEWLNKYWGKYRKTPSRVAFTRAFPDFRIKRVDDTAHFVDEVRKAHARHKLTELMRDQADLISEGRVSDAVELAMSGMVSVSASMGNTNEINVLEDWKPIYDEVKARKLRFEDFGMAGLPTGFDTLDSRTGGVNKGQSWIVGARLGEGKSFALLYMACTMLVAGYKVHFAALEMSKHEVVMRIHNLLSGSVGKQVFKSVSLAQGHGFELAAYKDFLNELPNRIKGQMTVSDARGIGAMEIASQIERHRPDAYFLDYLTLAKTSGDGGWQDIGKFSKDIKSLAGRYDVAFVSAAQLNRSGAESYKEPAGAETIAQADSIGQDADAIITIKKMSDRVNVMKLVKYRHGRAGYVWHNELDLDKGLYREVSKQKALDIIDADRDRADAEAEAGPPKLKRKPINEAAYATSKKSIKRRPLKKS